MINAELRAKLRELPGLTYYLYGGRLYALGETRLNCRELRRLRFHKDPAGNWYKRV